MNKSRKAYQSNLRRSKDRPGDCFRACLATIFQRPLEDFPGLFSEEATEETWESSYLRRVGEALAPMGWFITMGTGDPGYWSGARQLGLNELWISCGPASSGIEHAVVYQGENLFHDPHPRGDGIADLKCWYRFIPIGPQILRLDGVNGEECACRLGAFPTEAGQ